MRYIIENISSWQGALVASWIVVSRSFLLIIPSILGAIVIFTIGLVLSYWARRLVIEFLKAIKFEKISEQSGINKFLEKADLKITLAELIAKTVEWLIILVFFLAVIDILKLNIVSQMLIKVLGYIPNIIAAAFIFAAGYFVANLVEGLVKGALASVDHTIAKPLAKVARWLILLISFFTAVDQLQIAKGLINTFFQGLTYTIVLTVGLAVGLGSKDLIARVLNDWYEKIKK